jgi:hypothetical protein
LFSALCAATARMKQASTRRPSISTVQAPHCPRSQPFLVPVRRPGGNGLAVRSVCQNRLAKQFRYCEHGSALMFSGCRLDGAGPLRRRWRDAGRAVRYVSAPGESVCSIPAHQ